MTRYIRRSRRPAGCPVALSAEKSRHPTHVYIKQRTSPPHDGSATPVEAVQFFYDESVRGCWDGDFSRNTTPFELYSELVWAHGCALPAEQRLRGPRIGVMRMGGERDGLRATPFSDGFSCVFDSRAAQQCHRDWSDVAGRISVQHDTVWCLQIAAAVRCTVCPSVDELTKY